MTNNSDQDITKDERDSSLMTVDFGTQFYVTKYGRLKLWPRDACETLSRLNSAYFERYKKCSLEISSGFDSPSRFFYILKYKKQTNKQKNWCHMHFKQLSEIICPKQIPL